RLAHHRWAIEQQYQDLKTRSLTFPAVRGVVQAIFTAYLFEQRPQYLKRIEGLRSPSPQPPFCSPAAVGALFCAFISWEGVMNTRAVSIVLVVAAFAVPLLAADDDWKRVSRIESGTAVIVTVDGIQPVRGSLLSVDAAGLELAIDGPSPARIVKRFD